VKPPSLVEEAVGSAVGTAGADVVVEVDWLDEPALNS